MRVYRANQTQHARAGIEFSGGTISNGNNLVSQPTRTPMGSDSALAHAALFGGSVFELMAQYRLQPLHFCHGGRTDIDPHTGRFRNRVDGSAPTNDAYVERSFGRSRNRRLSESMESTGQHQDRIWRSEIAPGMSAGTAHNDLEAAAAERF